MCLINEFEYKSYMKTWVGWIPFKCILDGTLFIIYDPENSKEQSLYNIENYIEYHNIENYNIKHINIK